MADMIVKSVARSGRSSEMRRGRAVVEDQQQVKQVISWTSGRSRSPRRRLKCSVLMQRVHSSVLDQ